MISRIFMFLVNSESQNFKICDTTIDIAAHKKFR